MDDSREIKPFPEETFLPVNLLRWEDDVIIDPEPVRQQVTLSKLLKFDFLAYRRVFKP